MKVIKFNIGDAILSLILVFVAYYIGFSRGRTQGLSTAMIKQECSEIKERFNYNECIKQVDAKVKKILDE